ncbi:hypothetical protein BH23GEM3_BH23GEM3_26960 [soil metagenome]
MAGSQSPGSSEGIRSRTLPPADFLSRMPAPFIPCTLVFFAFESVPATPYSPASKPYCSNQASAQRLSASKSPSCSASTSSSVWLMSASAARTGRVPLMAKPARITAARNVSQPVLDVPGCAGVRPASLPTRSQSATRLPARIDPP